FRNVRAGVRYVGLLPLRATRSHRIRQLPGRARHGFDVILLVLLQRLLDFLLASGSGFTCAALRQPIYRDAAMHTDTGERVRIPCFPLFAVVALGLLFALV